MFKPFLIAWMVLLPVAARGQSPQTTPRAPIPAAEALTQSEKLVKDLFTTEYASRDSAVRSQLAAKLLEQAGQSADDPAARYVLLREARDVATSAGDSAQALKAVEALSGAFDIDPREAKLDLVKRLSSPATPETAKVAAGIALSVAEDALRADQLDQASRATAAAETAARASRDVDVIKAVSGRQTEFRALLQEAQRAKAAADTLAKSPDDAAAHLALGRYLALTKEDWDAALPHLAAGSDAALKALAAEDIARPEAPNARTKLATGWWDAAEKLTGPAQLALRRRAANWYRQALPQASGLTKALIEKRLDMIAASDPSGKSPPATVKIGDTTASLIPTIPAEKPKKGRKYPGILYANGDDEFSLAINGQMICEGKQEVVQKPVTIALDDVITVKVANAQYERGFMCVIVCEAGFAVITHHTTWQSYKPKDEGNWQAPAGITFPAPAALAYANYLSGPFTKAVQADQEAIWTSLDDKKGYLALKLPPECFIETKPLAGPVNQKATGSRRTAVLYANGDDLFQLYINGQRICEGGTKVEQRPVVIGPGDVVTVKVINKSYERGFSCVFKLDNGKEIRSLANVWKSYTPRSELAWYLPANIANTFPAVLGHDNYLREPFEKAFPAFREPLWAKDAKEVAFLAVGITANMITDPQPLKK